MSDSRIWILGAPDPEMEMIERTLRECGERVVYALDERGERVTPATAYRCPVPEVPEGATVYAVECVDVLPDGWVRIDHHRPGDPGYGRSPEEFMAASSIGQVIADLATQRTWREETPEGSVYFPTETPIKLAGWRTLLGGSHHDHDSTWGIDEIGEYSEGYGEESGDAFVKEMVEEGGYYHVPSIGWVFVASRGGHELGGCVDAIVIPVRFVLCAAADHCLGAAYRGECPGVDPDALMRWRAESRAKFQGRPVDEVLADVERAREALSRAPELLLAPLYSPRCTCGGVGDCGCCTGHPDYVGGDLTVCDMRHAYTVRTVLVEPFVDGATVDAAGVGDSVTIEFGAREEGAWDEGSHHTFVRHGVPELPDAASRDGEAYVTTVTVDGSGHPCRPKIVLGGCTTPDMVRAFLDHWAPAQGLVDAYGDPARGFAGAYLPRDNKGGGGS